MSDNLTTQNGGVSPVKFLVYLLEGMIMGVGAVLPGISGGVLCVIFGIYQPMMETLSHPKTGLKKYRHMILPIVLGFLGGFVLLAGVIAKLAEKEATIVTSLFIGLIIGTMPELFRDSAKEGRSRACWVALIVSTAALLAVFIGIKYGIQVQIEPNWGWFLFCGALWGISMIAPGMTSSSILMLMGLYYPMASGIAAMDMGVIIPFLVGIAATVILIARGVNALLTRCYGVVCHCIIGFVIASAIPIIPTSFRDTRELFMSIAAAAIGFGIAYLLSGLGRNDKQQ